MLEMMMINECKGVKYIQLLLTMHPSK